MTEFPNIQVQMVFQLLESAKIFTLSKTYFYDYGFYEKGEDLNYFLVHFYFACTRSSTEMLDFLSNQSAIP